MSEPEQEVAPAGEPLALRDSADVARAVDPGMAMLHDLLIDSVTEYAIYAVDPAGRVLTWNQGAQRLKGYAAEEIIGQHFSVFYPEEDVGAGLPQLVLSTALESGRYSSEGWRVRRDGSRFWASVVVTPLRSPAGEVLGFAKITRDLSDRRAADESARVLVAETAARAESERQRAEVQQLNQQLEEQAIELEAQTEEAQSLMEELENANDHLRNALEHVESAEAFTRGVLESIAQPFVVHDPDWRFRYVNAAAARVFARSGRANGEDMAGRVVWDVYPELLGTTFEREMRRAAAERVPVVCEAHYPGRDEWSELLCYPLPDGGLATQWTDITERKRAEERLQATTQRLSEALEREQRDRQRAQTLQRITAALSASMSAEEVGAVVLGEVLPAMGACAGGISVYDEPAQRFRTVAVVGFAAGIEQFREYRVGTGTPPDDTLRTRTPVEITAEEWQARSGPFAELIAAAGLQGTIAWPLVFGDRYLGTLGAHFDSDTDFRAADRGLLAAAASQCAQALERVRLYDDQRRARADSELANRAKGDFLAMMSHELRTPLNAITGYAQILGDGLRGPVTPEQQRDLGRIQTAAQHLLSVIGAVLDQSRIEAGQVHYDLQDVSVDRLLDAVRDFVSPQLRTKGLAWTRVPLAAPLTVKADYEKTLQILVNLAGNAVKFTQAGEVTVSAAADGERVAISVRDTGVGIAEAQLERIFEAFVQVPQELAVRREGIGLGLAISRHLARGMSGDLTVQSTVGLGSTFTLWLPSA